MKNAKSCKLMVHWHLDSPEMVPAGGLEPPTVRLEVGYSIQLNYAGGVRAYTWYSDPLSTRSERLILGGPCSLMKAMVLFPGFGK